MHQLHLNCKKYHGNYNTPVISAIIQFFAHSPINQLTIGMPVSANLRLTTLSRSKITNTHNKMVTIIQLENQKTEII